MSALIISDGVCQALGWSREFLGSLTIRQLQIFAYMKGLDVRFMYCDTESKGHLVLQMCGENRPLMYVIDEGALSPHQRGGAA